MSIEKVVIIIPTYNEALVIEETLLTLFQATSGVLDMEIHVLVFDSASTDKTEDIVKRLQLSQDRLHLKTEPKKTGLGAAYLQAMRYAMLDLSADIVMEFDADLSHQPKYIAPILAKIRTHDVVVGSRYIRGGSIPKEWGWHRKLLSVVGNYVARFILTYKYKDFTSGFRATRRAALEKALPDSFLSSQYAYKLQLLWSLHKNKAKICEHPIDFIDRQKGFSKLPANSIVDSLRVLLTLRFHALKSYFKMCIVGLSGVVVQALVYNVLRLCMSPITAAQCAIVAAIVNNYTLNNRFTFKRSAPRTHRYEKATSFGLFVGYSALMVLLQSYWLQLGIKYVGMGFLKENLIMFIGMIIGSLINYISYSRVIWREKKQQLPSSL